MTKNIMAAMLLFTIGCNHKQTTTKPLFSSEQIIEKNTLPEDPKNKPLPDGIPKDDWVVSLEAGQCIDSNGIYTPTATRPCPDKSGIFISEARAIKQVQYIEEYNKLRTDYEASRKLWEVQREVYESELQNRQNQIDAAHKNWFQENSFSLGSLSGLILGIAVTSAVVILTTPQP